MKVYWTETAQAHLDAIYVYISRGSPEYALRVVDRLTRRSQQLADFPLSGRKVPEFETENIPTPISGIEIAGAETKESWHEKWDSAR